jgi:hypothetical protein
MHKKRKRGRSNESRLVGVKEAESAACRCERVCGACDRPAIIESFRNGCSDGPSIQRSFLPCDRIERSSERRDGRRSLSGSDCGNRRRIRQRHRSNGRKDGDAKSRKQQVARVLRMENGTSSACRLLQPQRRRRIKEQLVDALKVSFLLPTTSSKGDAPSHRRQGRGGGQDKRSRSLSTAGLAARGGDGSPLCTCEANSTALRRISDRCRVGF